MQQALELFAIENYSEAISQFNQLLSSYPKDAQALTLRALAKLRVDDPKGALEDLDLAESSGNGINKFQLAFRRGQAFFKLENFSNAMISFQKAKEATGCESE